MPEDSHIAINRFFEKELNTLLKILRHYVVQTGLSDLREADVVAAEVLNATVVEALKHSERFEAAESATAWVLGVALNLIRRRLVQRSTLNYREPLLRDLYSEDSLTDDELFDLWWLLSTSEGENRDQALRR